MCMCEWYFEWVHCYSYQMVNKYMYVCMYVMFNVCVCINVCVCVYQCMYVCVRVWRLLCVFFVYAYACACLCVCVTRGGGAVDENERTIQLSAVTFLIRNSIKLNSIKCDNFFLSLWGWIWHTKTAFTIAEK